MAATATGQLEEIYDFLHEIITLVDQMEEGEDWTGDKIEGLEEVITVPTKSGGTQQITIMQLGEQIKTTIESMREFLDSSGAM